MYILLCFCLILTNKHYLLALVTNVSRIIIIININCEIFAKCWVNLKQLMRNSEILWRKIEKINTKKKTRLCWWRYFLEILQCRRGDVLGPFLLHRCTECIIVKVEFFVCWGDTRQSWPVVKVKVATAALLLNMVIFHFWSRSDFHCFYCIVS